MRPAGRPLGGGFYAIGDEMHVDLDEYIRAAGGDPNDPDDVAKAVSILTSGAAEKGIPTEVREEAPDAS